MWTFARWMLEFGVLIFLIGVAIWLSVKIQQRRFGISKLPVAHIPDMPAPSLDPHDIPNVRNRVQTLVWEYCLVQMREHRNRTHQ
jgi:hypothetical protein